MKNAVSLLIRGRDPSGPVPAVSTPTVGQPGRHNAQGHHALKDAETTHATAVQLPWRAGSSANVAAVDLQTSSSQMQGDQRTPSPPTFWNTQASAQAAEEGTVDNSFTLCAGGKEAAAAAPRGCLPGEMWVSFSVKTVSSPAGAGSLGSRPTLEQLLMIPGRV